MPAPVFVTGGSGVIGRALVARLVADGDTVVGLARSDEAAATLDELGARSVRGELLDEDGLARAMAGAGLVYNVAEDAQRLELASIAGGC